MEVDAPPAGGGREKGKRAGAGGPGAREKGKGEKEKSPGGSEDLLCDEEEALFDQDTLPGAGPKGPPLPEPQTQQAAQETAILKEFNNCLKAMVDLAQQKGAGDKKDVAAGQ